MENLLNALTSHLHFYQNPWEMLRNRHFWITFMFITLITIVYYRWQAWFPWYWEIFVFQLKYRVIGIFYLIPFVYASVFFWWRGALVVWIISITVLVPYLINHVYGSFTSVSLSQTIAASVVPLAICVIVAVELSWRDRQKRTAVEREMERQFYILQIMKAQEDEKRWIARELHDNAIQNLLVVANQLDTLKNNSKSHSSENGQQLESAKDVILEIIDDFRRLTLDLRPSILDNLGFVPALRWLVDRLNLESSINTEIVAEDLKLKLAHGDDVMLFRIAQEALFNIKRHSEATHATVILKCESNSLTLEIQDNGKGFDVERVLASQDWESKLGIMGMQERARLLNADLSIQSESGKGTCVSLRLHNLKSKSPVSELTTMPES